MHPETRSRREGCTGSPLRSCRLHRLHGMVRALSPLDHSPALSKSRHWRDCGGAPRGHNSRSKVEHLAVDFDLTAVEEFSSALPQSARAQSAGLGTWALQL